MRYFILFLLFPFLALSQVPVVEIHQYNLFANADANINGGFKICRDGDFGDMTQPFTVDYTISGTGVGNTSLTGGSQSIVIPAYSQCIDVEFSVTSDPVSDQTVTITLDTDASYTVVSNGFDSVSFAITADEPTPAFIGAEGAGRYAGSEVASGTWRGKTIYKTTLANLTSTATTANAAGGGVIIVTDGGRLDVSSRWNMGGYPNL